MSATDELRDTGYPNALRPELHQALSARGIDYWVAQGITFWNRDDGCECLAYGFQTDDGPRLAMKVVGFKSAEKVVNAALGCSAVYALRSDDSGYHGEGNILMGVYSSREKAEAASKDMPKGLVFPRVEKWVVE